MISADAAYSLQEFAEAVGLSDTALRSARRNGLQIHYAHNRAFILGRDWMQYLSEQSTDAPGPAVGRLPACRRGA